jgi:signal transduction histidine kinase
MTRPTSLDIDRSVAGCRIALSVIALVAVYVDPTLPTLTRWLPLRGGPFTIDPYALAALLLHLAYSTTLYVVLVSGRVSPARLFPISTCLDVGTAAVIALVTEGATSPFYPFFVFAVLAVGLRGGLRPALRVTVISGVLYAALIVVSTPHSGNVYLMRPAYLAITGYIVGFIGQRRLDLEDELRDLEAQVQRQTIARSLHDGYAQALAGVSLRVEVCRRMLGRGDTTDAATELADLQQSVHREYDELRGYIRALIAREDDRTRPARPNDTRCDVEATFSGSTRFVEHVLLILLEGVRNIGRHANAGVGCVRARSADTGAIRVTLDDDGVGFPDDAPLPWSIVSRVGECDGVIRFDTGAGRGAHLVIDLPGIAPA